ncbi:MFS transporter [Pseudonocardia sp. TRM90224]|uniref:MFS transporter n=1 Tax=Pseudonocardia sp. TRM90224 TaxID=2812678 RepID=UPI001E30E607|nr:MFS transporter [Pseudonocardia sp. TRM90224]
MNGRAALLVALGVDQFGAGLFLPLSLVYATGVVGLPLTVAAAAVTVGTVVGLAVPPIAGRMVDRVGARGVVVAAQVVQAAGASAYLFANGTALVFVGATLLAAGLQCFYSALFALIADVVGNAPKDRAFTVVNMIRGGAFGLGALVVGALLAVAGPGGLAVAITVNIGCFLAAATLLLAGVSARPGVPIGAAAPSAGEPSVAGVLGNRPYLGLIAATVLLVLPLDVFLIGVPVYVLDVLGAPAWLPGAMLALATTIGSVAGTLVLHLTRRWSRPTAIRRGAWVLLVWCAAMAATVAVPATWRVPYLLAATLLFTTANLVAAGRVNALAEAAAPAHSRGRHLAAFQYASTTAQIAAPGVVALFAIAMWLPWLVVGLATLLGGAAIGPVAARLPQNAQRDAEPSWTT